MSYGLLLQGQSIAVSGQIDLFVFLLIGVLAGAHCLGMCGPLVTIYANHMTSESSSHNDTSLSRFEIRQHSLFNVGRAASYAVLGGLFGLLGGTVFTTVDTISVFGDSVRSIAGIVIGMGIIIAGTGYFVGSSGALHQLFPSSVPTVFRQITGIVTDRVDQLAQSPRIVGLGAIHGVLPCPIIYPAYLYAFTTADPLRGALSLGILGVGTIPTLLLYGTAIATIGVSTRIWLHRLLGGMFILLGYIPLQHGLMLFGIHLPHPPIPFYQPI